ncbi:MAG: hypothetical protein AB7G44_09420 [Bacteroidia bacterium]
MDDLQQAFLNMLLKVQDNLEDNAAAYSTHGQIAPTKALLDAKIQSILETAGIATEDTTGVTEDKKAARTTLEKSMYKIANALNSYAEDNNLNTLARKARYIMSDLQKMQDTLLLEKALRLATLITPAINAALVAGYNVTAIDITDLPTHTTAYFGAIPEPKDAIEAKAVAGKKIDRLQTESRTLLKKLDGYVDSYRFDNVELWEEYYMARAIDDNPSGGGADVYEDTVNPSTTEKIIETLEYNAATPVKFENLGGVILQFALAFNGVATGSWVTVNPGETIETTMGAMAAGGDSMVVQNNYGVSCSFRVTIG